MVWDSKVCIRCPALSTYDRNASTDRLTLNYWDDEPRYHMRWPFQPLLHLPAADRVPSTERHQMSLASHEPHVADSSWSPGYLSDHQCAKKCLDCYDLHRMIAARTRGPNCDRSMGSCLAFRADSLELWCCIVESAGGLRIQPSTMALRTYLPPLE